MMNIDDGVTFNNVHCSEVGIELSDSSRPLLAESKSDFIEIPHKQGDVVVHDDTKKDITVTCMFIILDTGIPFHDHIRQIRDWLTTRRKVKLIFDDDPNYYYKAIAKTAVTYEQIAKYGEFTVNFTCDAYEYPLEGD